MTNSWVYLYSKFTQEALLFQGLGIFFLGAFYAGYYLLKRRRANMQESVPAPVIKEYLGGLISDAEALRNQLFGLLAVTPGGQDPAFLAKLMEKAQLAGISPQGAALAAAATGTTVGADPALLQKLQLLEIKMAEQAKSMETVVKEKERLALELADAKNKAGNNVSFQTGDAAAAAASGTAGESGLADLQAKISNLEAKLAEYSIIEDDLANLKRLQQENNQLRSMIEGKGGTVPAPAPTAAAPAAAAAAPATPAKAAAPAPAPAPAAPAAEAAAPALSAANTDEFEKIVDKVEASITPPAAAAAAPTPPAAAAPAAEAAAPPTGDKTDADLVEEFEKMLSS